MSEIRADKLHNVTGDNDSGIDLSTNDQVDIKIANSVKARVDSSGRLLVGKTSTDFNTEGMVISPTFVNLTRDGNPPLGLNRLNSDGNIIEFYKDGGTSVGFLGSSSGDLTIGTGDTGIRFSDASDSFFAVNGTAGRDNAIDVGNASFRFDDVRATNGTIQTSDRNDKQDIEELSDAEKRVAVVAKGLMRKFRWKSAVTKKGDNARTHFGIIAQDLQDAFTAEKLDVTKYAMFCSDTWWEKDGEVYKVESDAPSDATKKTRLGVRYSELLAFIISAI